jgi:hypothetical protein
MAQGLSVSAKPPIQKLTKLEIASELYKFAFAVKRQKFSERFPELPSHELDRKTAEYLQKVRK